MKSRIHLHQRRQPWRTILCHNVICLKTKNANMLTRSIACSQLVRLVWRSPWPLLVLMDRLLMAQVTQCLRQTEAVLPCRNWTYTLAYCGVLRLLHSMCGLPRRKCIPSFTKQWYNSCVQTM